MKKMFIFLFALCAIINILYLISIEPKFYLRDYPDIYRQQLDIIFGEDYEVGPRHTISEFTEHVDRSETYQYYYTWEITYKDLLGDKYTVELDNIDYSNYFPDGTYYTNFEMSVYAWMYSQVTEHFKKLILDSQNEGYIDTILLKRLFSSAVSDIPGYETIKGQYDIYTGRTVPCSFTSSNKLPELYKLNYKDWFLTYPYFIEVYVEKDDNSCKVIEGIVDKLSEETDGYFNLSIIIEEKTSEGTNCQPENFYYIWGQLQEKNYSHRDEYSIELFREYEKIGLFG